MGREVEIIYTGMCVFLNLEKENDTMGDPAVILVRTGHRHDHDEGHNHEAAHDDPIAHEEHIPFIAFDSDTAEVTSTAGAAWTEVPGATDFQYVPITGVELSITEDGQKGPLSVHRTYRTEVVKKDDYWPAAKDRWNRAYVPKRDQKPSSMVVAAYMRLHTGEIKAGEKTAQKWRFPVNGDDTDLHEQHFAFDVEYGKVPNADGKITLLETCLDCGHFERKHEFKPKDHVRKLTLFIGNNTLKDLENAVRRKQSKNAAKGAHFTFINKIADATLGLGDGPVPSPVKTTEHHEGVLDGEQPAGGTDGYCGPANGNN